MGRGSAPHLLRMLACGAAAGLALACVRRPASFEGTPDDGPASTAAARAADWDRTLSAARANVLAGRYAAADSTLLLFAVKHPNSAGARESGYWRGIFLLDPANPSASLQRGAEQLDGYLDDIVAAPHGEEARVFRGLARRLDSLTRSATDSGASHTTVAKSDSTLQKENQQLREQLDKATEELARIKRRLAKPKP